MKKCLLLLIVIALAGLQKANVQTPLAYYRLNGNANDTSVNNLNATLKGVLRPVADRLENLGNVLNFNGSIRIDVAHNILFRPTNVTLTAWVYFTSTAGAEIITVKNLANTFFES